CPRVLRWAEAERETLHTRQGGVCPVTIQVSAARQERRRRERAVPLSGWVRRRPVRHPLDAHGRSQSRTGPAADALRRPAANPAIAWLLALVWAWQRKREFAVVRRARPAPPGCRAAIVV